MKNRNFILFYILLSVVFFGFAACNNDDEDDYEKEVENEKFLGDYEASVTIHSETYSWEMTVTAKDYSNTDISMYLNNNNFTGYVNNSSLFLEHGKFYFNSEEYDVVFGAANLNNYEDRLKGKIVFTNTFAPNDTLLLLFDASKY